MQGKGTKLTEVSLTVAVGIKVTGVNANYLNKATWWEGKGTWYQAGSASENLGAATEPNLQAASEPSNVKADLKVFKASFPRSLCILGHKGKEAAIEYVSMMDRCRYK